MKNFFYNLLLAYLRIAAIIQLKKISPKHIIGITGSVGKTSAREAVNAVLKEKYKVKSAKKSLNSETGIPLDLLNFADSYGDSPLGAYFAKVILLTPIKLLFDWNKFDVYICEMGVDKPGDMDYLLTIVKPDIGVLLNVYPVHTFNFPGGVSQIAEEKGKLLKSAEVKISYPDFGGVKPFLIEKKGFVFTENYGETFAAAAAVGLALGISLEQCKKNLEKNLLLPPGRMSVFEGINGSTIIDSTYNSSRVPAIAALKTLKEYEGKRKIVVLGDMRELGDLAKEEHGKVAKEALADADLIYTFGPLTEKYFPEHKKVVKFREMKELISKVKETLKSGDVVLIKGSQNTIMLETLVEAILKNKVDVANLARRGEFWEKKRQALL